MESQLKFRLLLLFFATLSLFNPIFSTDLSSDTIIQFFEKASSPDEQLRLSLTNVTNSYDVDNVTTTTEKLTTTQLIVRTTLITTSIFMPAPTETPAPASNPNKTSERTTKKGSNKTKTTHIIIIVVCGVLFLLFLIIAAVNLSRCFYRRFMTRIPSLNNCQSSLPMRLSAQPSDSNYNSNRPIFRSEELFKSNSVQLRPSLSKSNAPEHVAAEKFIYKGPLVLQTKPPDEIPMVHELENDRPPSLNSHQQIMFDATMNEVHEIGSEVEVLLQGQTPLPRKARSSLPSPYAEVGPKPSQKRITAAVEARRDRAIRE